jgi:transposase
MAPLDYRTVIVESEGDLLARLRTAHHPLIRRRLRFLIALKATPGLSRAQAGRKLGLEPTGSEEVWKRYKKGGITLIGDYPFKGKPATLSAQDQAWLTEDLQQNSGLTLAQSAERIKQHTGADKALSPQAVHYIFKALKIKKKTGRPSHIHKDEAKVALFKKKSSRP